MKPILEVRGISKKFNIKHEQQSYLSLRDSLSNLFTKRNKSDEEFWALKDVSFDVYPGESVGIIGRNGAGKSTLLKILSKITPPSNGSIISRGRIASLLEVGTGFHSELSGRENIYLNGSILGLKKAEINKQFDAIVDFSGVEKFLDTPLKHYSSGMQLRLAFAVAAHLDPEILIVDEVLAVGDAEFQKKCIGKMGEVSKSGRTILFVSHHMGAVQQLCNRALLLSNGALVAEGKVNEILHLYSRHNKMANRFYHNECDKEVYLKSILILGESQEPQTEFTIDDDIYVVVEISSQKIDLSRYTLLISVLDSLKRKVFSNQCVILNGSIALKINKRFLVRGLYSLQVLIYIPAVEVFDEVVDCCEFSVLETGSIFSALETYDYGVVFSNSVWV